MSLSIDEAIKKVLSFLKSIPMAPATVKYYSCCCSHVRDYCQRNALQEFSYKEIGRAACRARVCQDG